MTLLAGELRKNNKRFIYYAEINGTELLTKAEVLKADADNLMIGKIMCLITSNLAILSLILIFVYKATIYKNNKAKEIYDLSFTDNEIQQKLYYDDEIEITKNIYIKTSYPKWALWVYIVFLIISIGLMIGSFFIKEPGKWVCLGIGLFIGLISALGFFDLLKNYEILDNDKLIVNRFFKKKIILIQDVKHFLQY